MFCPKCGTKNPDDGKFCRSCGTDLNLVSDAVAGKIKVDRGVDNKKKTHKQWESAMSKLFMGFAFLAVSIVLGVSNAAAGRNWWFWLLIPAFAMMGSGVAHIIRLRTDTGEGVAISTSDSQDEKTLSEKEPEALPASKTEYVSPETTSYNTGDLVPPSVVEETTRHLKADPEGETMTLPKDKS